MKKAIIILIIFFVITLPEWVEEIINEISMFIEKFVEFLKKLYYIISKIINLINAITLNETNNFTKTT
ncbi:MAG TPA: hypothetical protein EYH56_03085 [Nanoarchaeota archaeon]|nr:hypothetical protein [Nanoarchaeota archaeon]